MSAGRHYQRDERRVCDAALNADPRGAFLDISKTEAVISSLGWVVSKHLIGGVTPQPNGNKNTTSAPSGTFATADAPINIAANRDDQWLALARYLGRDDLIVHPDYATREDRKRNRAALKSELETVLRTRSAADWVAGLNPLDVPAGPVLSVPAVLAEPQIAGRGLISAVPDMADPVVASPIVMNGARPVPDAPPPALGQGRSSELKNEGVS